MNIKAAIKAVLYSAVIYLAISSIWYACEWHQYGALIMGDVGDNIASVMYSGIVGGLLYCIFEADGDKPQ